MNHNVPVKQCIRVLEFIKSAGSVSFQSFSDGSTDKTILNSIQSASQKILCQTFLIDDLRKRDLIGVKGNTLVLSDAGVSWLKRNTGSKTVDKQERFQNQHRLLETQTTRVNGQQQTVQINGNESPLYRLRKRKTRSGTTWISDEEFVAGERLRADFTFGQSMQRITSNWEAYSTPLTKNFGSSDRSEISDSAVDARTRVEKALDYVGPELASVLIDVCCFLKGLESVEREGRWPPRSAKLMVRTGLNLLARHYGTGTGNGLSFREICSWGQEGYRPEISHQ